MRFIVNEVTKVAADGDRSLILMGEVERGVVREGMTVHLEMLGQSHRIKKVKSEHGEQLSEASAGQQVGLILTGLHNIRVQLGEVLVEVKEADR